MELTGSCVGILAGAKGAATAGGPVKRTEVIVAAVAALWLLGAVASFWRASNVSFIIGLLLAGGTVAGLAVLVARKVLRR